MKNKLVKYVYTEPKKLLIEPPQKDGSITTYKCGLLCVGTWATRLEEHSKFVKSAAGKYILILEGKAGLFDKLMDIIKTKRK